MEESEDAEEAEESEELEHQLSGAGLRPSACGISLEGFVYSFRMNNHRFKVIPDVSLIMIRDEQVLLIRRSNTGYEDGNYGLPSGHKDPGETSAEGACREAKEEIGITADPAQVQFVHVMDRKNWDERVSQFFLATKWEGEITNAEPHKHDDVRWFRLDDLPDNMVPFQRQAIEKWRASEMYSTIGW